MACHDPVVARVNGVPIYRRALSAQADTEAQHHRTAPAADLAARRLRIERMVLGRMIEAEKVRQAAERLGIAPDASTLAAQAALRRERLGGDIAYRQWLAATRTTTDEFTRQIREDYLREQVVARLMPDVQVPQAELARYLEHQREEAREREEKRNDEREKEDEDERENASRGRAELLSGGVEAARAALTLRARAALRNVTQQRLHTDGRVEVYAPYAISDKTLPR